MRRAVKVLAAAAAALLLWACDGRTVYDRYRPTLIDGWEKNDTLVYDVPRLAATGPYRQEIGVRISGAYPFTGLSLLVEQTVEPGHRRRADTLSCRLYDDKGNILGRGIGSYQYDFILADAYLHKGDSLHVVIRHIMKREILPGISDIGFRMTRK